MHIFHSILSFFSVPTECIRAQLSNYDTQFFKRISSVRPCIYVFVRALPEAGVGGGAVSWGVARCPGGWRGVLVDPAHHKYHNARCHKMIFCV